MAPRPAASAPAWLETYRNVGADRLGELAIPELDEPSSVDALMPADAVPFEVLEARARALRDTGYLDDFPAPRRLAVSGDAIFRALARVAVSDVPSFTHADTSSAMPPEARAEAAAQALALLRGIYGLELEIRDRIARHRRA